MDDAPATCVSKPQLTQPPIYKSDAGKREVLGRYRELLEQWPVTSEHLLLNTCAGDTFVIASGDSDKPAVLLLHGSVSNSLAWMGDVAQLAKHHRVFAVDIIGEAGLSAANRPSYESGDYARWLNDVANGLSLDRFALVGLSLGGWMALEYTRTYPQRVTHLSLLCPGGVVRESRSFIGKALFYMLLGRWGKDQIVKLINGGKLPDQQGMRDALEFTNLIGQHLKPRTAKLPLFADADLQQLDMPVQVFCGANDALIPPQLTINRLQSLVQNLESHLLPDVGHVISGQVQHISRFLMHNVATGDSRTSL